jgi:hypothetical protein
MESTGIDPCGAGSYNLMCSGSSLVLLPICRYGSRVDRGKRWACSSIESALIMGVQGTAEKARDGAPKAG